MKIVPDTNLIIQGLMFRGDGRKIINLAHSKKIDFYGSENSFKEAFRVFKYTKFKKILDGNFYTPEKILISYKSIVNLITIDKKYKNKKYVDADADDDEFIRIAKTVNAKLIISNDKHLKNIKKIDDIRIVDSKTFLKIYPKLLGKTF